MKLADHLRAENLGRLPQVFAVMPECVTSTNNVILKTSVQGRRVLLLPKNWKKTSSKGLNCLAMVTRGGELTHDS